MKSWCLAVLAAACLSGCAEDKLIGRPELTIVTGAELPPPAKQDLILQQRSYSIGPLDRVTIDVYGLPELSRTMAVDADGTISMPLVGVIQASGQSSAQLSALVAQRLRGRYVRDPQVTVSVDTVNQMITVDGAVDTPGLYPVNGQMTLIRAISAAKGVTEFARTNYVVVFRQVNGQKLAAVYDLRAIRQGIYADPEVYANDVVSVGDSGTQRAFKTLLSSGALLTAPLVAILQ